MMIKLLKKACKLKMFNYTDIQIAEILSEKKNYLLILIIALLSKQTRTGSTCLILDDLYPNIFFKKKHIKIANKLWKIAKLSNINILQQIKQFKIICNPNKLTSPLVLFKNKLYFQKIWTNEKLVGNFLKNCQKNSIKKTKTKKIIKKFFKKFNIQKWQKIAITISIFSKISFISGEPGTGKTTLIIYLLIILTEINKNTKIRIGAPTGKASSRITESIKTELKKIKLNNLNIKLKTKKSETIHQILGSNINNNKFYYNENNKLLIDYLILDESSMISLSMMSKIIESLNKNTSIIFIGDKNQLPPIENGSIFKDICYFSKFGYSKKRILQIKEITGYNLQKFKLESDSKIKIKDNICILKENYRFNANSEIKKFSDAIKKENIKKIQKIIQKTSKNIKFQSITSFNELIIKLNNLYNKHLLLTKKTKNYKKILKFFQCRRILTASKKGKYSTTSINTEIKKMHKNYIGYPIIITKNNYDLKLFNGDTGIILPDSQNKLNAYFYSHEKKIKKISLDLIENYETSYAMTIHKSQGSEFDYVYLILSNDIYNIITKELIYTAITRAKKKLTIFFNIDIIKSAKTNQKRSTGLKEIMMS